MAVDLVGWPDEDDKSGLDNHHTPGERHYHCDYCGWIFPSSQLRIEPHTGLRACIVPPNDYSDPSENDEKIISRKNRLLYLRKEEVTE